MSLWKIHNVYLTPFSDLAPDIPRSIETPTGALTLQICGGEDFALRGRDAVYALYNINMTRMLEGTSGSYTEDSKRNELFNSRSIFLLLLDKPLSSPPSDTVPMPGALPRTSQRGKYGRMPVVTVKPGNVDFLKDDLVGYCSFRFDTEETLGPRLVEVVYCYELQIRESSRGLGLAKLLIETMEAIGRKANMEKSMLTCSKKNETALRFYTKLGYEPDEIDPTRMAAEESEDEDDDWEEVGSDGEPVQKDPPADYVILSKGLPFDVVERNRYRFD